MERKKLGRKTSTQYRRKSFVSLRLVGATLVGGVSLAEALSAQTLTVRPREMAIATKTLQAGLQTVDGKPIHKRHPSGPYVYVPKQCVGTQRCALVVISNVGTLTVQYMADKYGMIFTNVRQGGWGYSGVPKQKKDAYAVVLDRHLKMLLQTFAVDPTRIAIAGRCATGPSTSEYAASNPDVFSLVLVGTPHAGDPPVKVPGQELRDYFIATGMTEQKSGFWEVRKLRDRGYTVTHSHQFRGHTHTLEEYNFWGQWLRDRWAIPDPAARPIPYTFGSPPILTVEVMTQMIGFWRRFMDEPVEIKDTARRALVREVLIPIGQELISTLMMDMSAMAAWHPTVAQALEESGLTPQQHDAYRAALASAYIYRGILRSTTTQGTGVVLNPEPIPPDSIRSFLGLTPSSAVVKNFEFMAAHPDEVRALQTTRMWETP